MGRKLALIVGNAQYEDAGLARLSAPDADVHALAGVLRDSTIGAFDEVESVVDASFAHTRRAIARFFDGRKRDDLLLLYFSGHGVRDEYGHLHLAVRDTERSVLAATAIEASFITECMDRSASKRLVLVLDCCHSGAFSYGSKSAQGASVGTAVAFEGTGRGRVVLTATDATQYAWEGDTVVGAAQPSVFTRHVTEGLRTGAADLDGDGIITIDELYDYVYDQVLNDTAKQTPGKWAFGQQGDIIIARNPLVPDAREGERKTRSHAPRTRTRSNEDDPEAVTTHSTTAAIRALLSRVPQPAAIVALVAAAVLLAFIVLREPGQSSVVRTPEGQTAPTPQATQPTTSPSPPAATPIEASAPPPDATSVQQPPTAGSAPKPDGPRDARAATPRQPKVPASRTAAAPAAAVPPTGNRVAPQLTGNKPALETPTSVSTLPPVVNREPPAVPPRDDAGAAAPAPVRPIVPTVTAESEIRAALQQYRQARNQMDVDALKQVWPGAPVAPLLRSYSQITAETVQLTNCTKPDPQGATASIQCDEQVSSSFKTGATGKQTTRATFSLQRQDDRWVITQIRRR
jgi:uncharacterized caspase-like protein